MYTRCFERENEIVNISEYGFAWYVDDRLVRTGLVGNLENDIRSLLDEGFIEIL